MRLQLSIHRNTLPPVRIIFTTGVGPATYTKSRSDATVADLLHDVNVLVPLESQDGEWGLEDYVVEVAATADQEALYECLHFQTLESVFRDDDEVVIRAVGSEELRSRRLGGRVQITGAGRHLVDGVVWGRKWIREAQRPGLIIPPRKKRRLLATEEEDHALGLFAGNAFEAGTGALGEAGDDEDDENEDEDYEETEDTEQDTAIVVRDVFDNVDDLSDAADSDVEEDEVQLLLRDAEELNHSSFPDQEGVLDRRIRARTHLGKRKRIDTEAWDDENDGNEDSVFEGFSTPVRDSRHAAVDAVAAQQSDTSDESTMDSDSETDSDDDSLSGDVPRKTAASKAIMSWDKTNDGSSDSSYDSDPKALGESRRVKTIPGHVLSIGSAGDRQAKSKADRGDSDLVHSVASSTSSGVSDASSSSEAESDSDSSSDSEEGSAESESSDEAATKVRSPRSAANEFSNKLESLQTASAETPSSSAPVPPRAQSAPGQGSRATHKKNQRIKMKKQLVALKAAGELPAHADFSDLKDYKNRQVLGSASPDAVMSELESAKARLLEQITFANDKALASIDGPTSQEAQESESAQETFGTLVAKDAMLGSEPHMSADVPEQSTVQSTSQQALSGPPAETSSKRAKLDIAASRRLLFGSLGLRAPKTQAEEEALRLKLSQKSQSSQSTAKSSNHSQPEVETGGFASKQESWQDKLIVSAVECVQKCVTLPPPPFPFVQHWHRKGKPSSQRQDSDLSQLRPEAEHTSTDKNVSVDTLQYDGSSSPTPDEARLVADGFAPNMSTIGERVIEDNNSNPESKTLSFEKEEDGMPIPTDFAALAELDRAHLAKGTIIAYKEICLGAEGKIGPQISAYRVAQVDAIDDEDMISVVLAHRYRHKQLPLDPETGEKVKNNFEIDGSQDEEDDGVRQLPYTFMLEPKLVEAAKVQVPESTTSSVVAGTKSSMLSEQEEDAIIPNSVGDRLAKPQVEAVTTVIEEIQIDAPRRKEITTIIKEAGFESAVDDGLLDPFQMEGAKSSPPRPAASVDEPLTERPHFSQDEHMENTTAEHADQDQSSITETSKVILDDDVEGSNPFFPASANEDTTNHVENETEAALHQEEVGSSPPVSPQLTVEYPHISQIELASSVPLQEDSTRPSSNQDAQRVSQPPDVNGDMIISLSMQENTVADHPADNTNGVNDDELESLHSEIFDNVDQEPMDDGQDEEAEVDENESPSFSGGRGRVGRNSSYHESDDDPEMITSGTDEFGLPSVRKLTSSQREKIKRSSAISGSTPSNLQKESKSRGRHTPAATKHTFHAKGKNCNVALLDGQEQATGLQDDLDYGYDNDTDDDKAFAPGKSYATSKTSRSRRSVLRSSQPKIKISASQQAARDKENPTDPSRNSIPAGSQVVDLTMSSDPVSSEHSDGEYQELGNRTGRRARAANGGGRKMETRKSVSDVGLGTKRFLTMRKSHTSSAATNVEGGYF